MAQIYVTAGVYAEKGEGEYEGLLGGELGS